MLFSNITIIDENLSVKENMYVGTAADRIDYIGSEKPDKDYGRVYDGAGRCLMSGFFNGHGHSPMTLMRGYGENMDLNDWLFGCIFPYEDHLSGEAVYYSTLLALSESLRNGIVSTNDMYYFCEDMVRAYKKAGVKGNISRSVTITENDGPIIKTPPVIEAMRLFDDHDGAMNGKIKIDMSLHAEYTNSEQTARELAEITQQTGTGMHVHVSETKKEVMECRKRHGKTPVRFLADLGLFDTRTIAAHCVWLDDEDYEILKEKGVFVAVNPVSNLKLASGVANVPEMLRRGIGLCIGTDSVASNNSLDLITEMKIFAIAAKMFYNDPSAISVSDALYAATRGGALSQGREDTGALKEGLKADLIVLDISGPNMHPLHSLKNNIVYSAGCGDVVMTMADGEVLYENGEYLTIDIEKVIFETERINEKILGEL